MLRTAIASFSLLFAITACGQSKTYGEAFEANKTIDTYGLVRALNQSDSVSTTLEAEIITSCAKKGCWMSVVLPNEQEMRVTFKDYGFFVPTKGLQGKKAIIQGTAFQTVTDVATLQHYAEDAGKSEEEIAKITEPKKEFSMVATGVTIVE